MECLTCHKMHFNGNSGSDPDFLLVGAPYRDRREICTRCHQSRNLAHVNPHGSKLDYMSSHYRMKCNICHAESSKVERGMGKNVALKAADVFLCWQCHPPMEGDFMEAHYLLDIAEISSNSFNLNIDGEPKLVDNETGMYLDSFNRVTCSTCHEPHEPYDANAKRGGKARVKVRSTEICDNCHKR